MRTIKFKLVNNNKKTKCFISFDNVYQFTGLLDRNGKEIYEGDTLRIKKTGHKPFLCHVVFSEGTFIDDFWGRLLRDYTIIEVVKEHP